MKEVFIERQNRLMRIAFKNKGRLEECYMEEYTDEPHPGEIYRGIVRNIIPAIKCAFVDVGYRENCFMYMDNKLHNVNIKKGDELLVQVVKEKTKNKAPKVTTAIDLPGRYCVLQSLVRGISFSQKIKNEEFKNKVLETIKCPSADIGIVIRTNAEKVDIDIIKDEVDDIFSTYENIMKELKYGTKAGLIYSNGGILSKVIRDRLDSSIDKIYVDSDCDYDYIRGCLKNVRDVDIPVIMHEGDRTLFDYYGIEQYILGLRNSRIQLSCGGFIVIDKTEAMYVIDVNSGKNVKQNSIEKTAYITNMEAAEEAARQIMMRNLSGIILIDFIDMTRPDYKNSVISKMAELFTEDKCKAIVYPFTELNLVQIARRQIGRPVNDFLEEECPNCCGRGKRLKFSYICLLVKNDIIRIDRQNSIENIHIEIDSDYKDDINGDKLQFIKDIDALNKKVYLTFTDKRESFKVEALIFSSQIENLLQFRIYG